MSDQPDLGARRSRGALLRIIIVTMLLGFATRPLYEETKAIIDVHMNSGVEPYSAHLGDWKSREIIERCIELLRANMA